MEPTRLNKKDFLAVLAGSILLCFFAFLNKYPLTFWDTGTYLASGFKNFYPEDRPVFYGWFIRHMSLKSSFWLVIWFQGLFCALLIYRTILFLYGRTHIFFRYFLVVCILTIGTALSNKVSTLMPDIFTPIVLLSMLLLLFDRSLSKWEIAFYSVLLLYAVLVHNSHTVIILGTAAIAGLVLLFKRNLIRHFIRRRLFLVVAIIISCNIIAPSVNYALSGHFTLSRWSHGFIMNSFVNTGIAKDYLEDQCETHDFKLCQYKDSLLFLDFMWDWSKSPFYKFGGPDSVRAEYEYIIRDVFTSPNYMPKFIYKSLQKSGALFFNLSLRANDENPPQNSTSSTFYHMQRTLEKEIFQFSFCNQNRGVLDFSFTDTLQDVLLLFSCFLVILVFFSETLRQSISSRVKLMLALTVMFLYSNALICATFADVFPRYQNRLFWVLAMMCILIVLDLKPVKGFLERVRSSLRETASSKT